MEFTGLFVYAEKRLVDGVLENISMYASTPPAIFIKKLQSDSVPATIPNPYDEAEPDYYSVTDCVEIADNIFRLSQVDFKTNRDCIWSQVMILGSGSEAAGVAALSPSAQKTVTKYNIGTAAQIAAAEPNVTIRFRNAEFYNSKMREVRVNRLTQVTGHVFASCKDILINLAAFAVSSVSGTQIQTPSDVTPYLSKGLKHYFRNSGGDITFAATVTDFVYDGGTELTTITYNTTLLTVTTSSTANIVTNMPGAIRNMLFIQSVLPNFGAIEQAIDLREAYVFDGLTDLEEDGITGIMDFFTEAPYTRYQPYAGGQYGGCKTHPYFADKVPSGFADIVEFADYLADYLKWGNLTMQL